MPKIKLKKPSQSLVNTWYLKKKKNGITDEMVSQSVGITRRRVSQALNRYEVNPADIELLTNYFNNF
jgi:hypothetical protein